MIAVQLKDLTHQQLLMKTMRKSMRKTATLQIPYNIIIQWNPQ